MLLQSHHLLSGTMGKVQEFKLNPNSLCLFAVAHTAQNIVESVLINSNLKIVLANSETGEALGEVSRIMGFF